MRAFNQQVQVTRHEAERKRCELVFVGGTPNLLQRREHWTRFAKQPDAPISRKSQVISVKAAVRKSLDASRTPRTHARPKASSEPTPYESCGASPFFTKPVGRALSCPTGVNRSALRRRHRSGLHDTCEPPDAFFD